MKVNIRLCMILVSGILFSMVVFFSECNNKNQVTDKRGEAYADATTCIQCHKSEVDSYSLNGHFHTSSPVTGGNLQKNIITDNNDFILNDSLKLKIEKRPDGIYQAGYLNNNEVIAKRMDVAFGSAEKAQTYGYWQDSKLYELPLSYFKSIRNWANSPGFPSHTMYYGREIVSRCFECHGTYVSRSFEKRDAALATEIYDKESIMYGIDCQRCHGPAAKHVNFHLDNPEVKQAKFITTYSSLNRQQKLDMCGICHSGNDQSTMRSTFYFMPGDTAANFYEPNFGGATNEPDVHGNQYAMLRASKCFISDMTCTTCHDSHAKDNGNLVMYANKCLDCHKEQTHNFCKMAPKLGADAIAGKCIDCHMPALPSKLISYRKSATNHTSQYLLQTHRIAIYPEQTKQILSAIKNIRNSN